MIDKFKYHFTNLQILMKIGNLISKHVQSFIYIYMWINFMCILLQKALVFSNFTRYSPVGNMLKIYLYNVLKISGFLKDKITLQMAIQFRLEYNFSTLYLKFIFFIIQLPNFIILSIILYYLFNINVSFWYS